MGAHKVPRAYRHLDAISLIKPTISMGTLQLYFKTFKKSIDFLKKIGGNYGNKKKYLIGNIR